MGLQLRAVIWLRTAHQADLEQPGAACTLEVRAGFRVIFACTTTARRPTVTTSLEVEPEGAPFVREWLLAICRKRPSDVAGLTEVTRALFGDPVPV